MDTETSTNLVHTFQLYNVNISPNMIVKPTRVLCWAAGWVGQKKIHFRDERDEDFLEKIWELINEADAIIHYNGKAFDMKHLNREFLLAKMDPPSSYTDIDLLGTMRKKFKMASNKLEWVSIQLGYEGKIKHRGIQLWFDCMEGNPKAWKEMKRYNIQDVVLLEEVYKDILPWIDNHPNWGHYIDNDLVCRNCGSGKVKKDGIERRTIVPYQRYRCTNCRRPVQGRKKLKLDENNKKVLQPSTK